MFQLLTYTTAGTRSIVTLLPLSDALHGNDPHCRGLTKGFYRCDCASVRIQTTKYILIKVLKPREQGTYGEISPDTSVRLVGIIQSRFVIARPHH